MESEPVDDHDPALVDMASRLFDMARRGETDQLIAYVEAGVPVNLSNDSGDTLLMLAAYHGQAGTVRSLLERGAEPDRVNDRGQTPLAGAVFKDELDTVRALLAAGADPDAGTPTARATATMFERGDYLALFAR